MKGMNRELQNRRDFLRTAARLVLLTGVGALAVKLFRRESVTACINNSVCGNCRVFSECGLPAARAVRRNGTGAGHG